MRYYFCLLLFVVSKLFLRRVTYTWARPCLKRSGISTLLPSLKTDGESRTVEMKGTGPVDAVCKAIDKVVNLDIELTEFAVTAVTEGIDSLGEVTIRVAKDGSVYSGRSSDSDIVVASAKAYVNAINRLITIGVQDRSATTGAV